MKRFYLIFLLLFYFNALPSLKAQKAEIPGAAAFLKGDTLSLQNGTLVHQYLWNEGDIQLASMTDKRSGKKLEFAEALSDFNIPEGPVEAADIEIKPVRVSTFEKEYLSVEIIQRRAGMWVKRVIQLYPESPAVRHIFYYRGHSALDEWEKLPSSHVGMIETRAVAEESPSRMALLRSRNLSMVQPQQNG